MSQLCAQSIRALCLGANMIDPFVETRTVVNGKSSGLSSASYDVRIAHDLVLGPSPTHLLARMMRNNMNFPAAEVLEMWRARLSNYPTAHALAHTIEDFRIPKNVVGYVCDKSSYARVFVTAFNTLFDPGFVGNATLELVNLSDEVVEIKAGDPICQFTFHWLDKETDRPYRGKYQNQTKGAHGPRYEAATGATLTEALRAC